MTLVYLLGFACILVVVWLGYGVKRIGAVSQGEPIEARGGTALLLIDLQSVFWDHGPYSDAAKHAAHAAIHREVEAARAQGHPVIALRQEWSIPATKVVARLTMKGQAVAGSAGTELAHDFAALADHVIVKWVQDGFETGALDVLLGELGVGTLRLAGLDFNYCVQKTALAARNRGYSVTVVEDATLAAAPTQEAQKRMSGRGVAFA
ncbi:MAG: isochorismatase family cysteine hydrolase [Pseudomonadota bacterium]